LGERWAIIRQHCRLAVEGWGYEDKAMRSMRARLMAYSKGFPQSKQLRERFQHISTLAELDEIASDHLAAHGVEAVVPTACSRSATAHHPAGQRDGQAPRSASLDLVHL